MNSATDQQIQTENSSEPIRVLVLRAVDGAGGGADQIILRNAVHVSPQIQMRLCFLRHQDDAEFDFDVRANKLGLDYTEILHRGPFDLQVLSKLADVIQTFQPQVVHSHEYKVNYLNWRLSQRLQFATLATSHGWTGESIRERYFYYPADKWILRSFDHVLAVSDQIRNELRRWQVAPDKVDVILNAIDPQEYVASQSVRTKMRTQLNVDDDTILLGAVGRLERQKRFDILIDTFAQHLSNRPNLRLMIAGEGSLKAKLQQQIVRLGLTNRCQLLGHRSDIRDLYQAFDVLVQSSDYEGTPTVVVEAMALQVPVVATDAGGTAQLLQHKMQGLIVPKRDPVALADAIRQTIDQPEITQRRIQAARTHVQQHLTYAVRTQQLEAVYRRLAARKSE
ncbi:MAG: glycosyltransferase [Planctomycetales bacterium]|nr:glycosyltransferase [Planctomycetales bacterium]